MIKGKDLILMVRALSHEKDIPEKEVLDAVEKALGSAIRKQMGIDADVFVSIDSEKGNFDIYRTWTIVAAEDDIGEPEQELTLAEAQRRHPTLDLSVGDTIDEPLPILPGADLGRIAAQVFKQGILENVRKAKRVKSVVAYTRRLGSLVVGVVKAVRRDQIVLDVNGEEACLPREETLPRESFRIGDRVRGYLYDVHYEARGPQLFLSRSRPEMLIELFKLEVPEVSEELIEIRAAARDAGHRAKVAVKTNDGRIDPVGACVGMRGARVQAISNELGGERIDIVLWDDNPAQLVISAMAPAEVLSLLVDEDRHSIDVIVREDQLSQAIGRNGQNVRLASELTGWSLNIMTEQESEEKQREETSSLLNLFKSALDVDEDVAALLIAEGFSSLEEIAYVALAELVAIEGFDEEIATELQLRAKSSLGESSDKVMETIDPKLLELPHITQDLAIKLAFKGITQRDELAELAVDDLIDLIDIDEKQAAEVIMAARAHWFE